MKQVAFLPDIFVGPVRVGARDDTLAALMAEPFLFAAHYAVIDPAIRWPAAMQATIERVRERYEAHDAVLDLIEKLRRQVKMAFSADLARRLAEGLELHTELADAPAAYREVCREHLGCLEVLSTLTAAGERLHRLAELLGFSPAERQILTWALACTVLPALQLFMQLVADERRLRAAFWQTLFDLDATALAAAFSAQGRLAGSGLLAANQRIPEMSAFWVEFLLNVDVDFEDALLEPLRRKESPAGASRLPAEDRAIVRSLLKASDAGVNVLIHGKPAVDKGNLVRRLVEEAEATPYTLVADIPDRDQPAAVMVAQRLLSRQSRRPVLVVEKSHAVLTRILPEGFAFFGLIDDDERDARPLDERLLAENPVPTLWLANDPRRLHQDTLARFLFHAEAQRVSRAERQAMVESIIEALPVAGKHKTELAKFEGLSEQQLASARRLAQLTAGRSRGVFARHLLLAAKRSQKALARTGKDEARIPVTDYSLDYLHCAGRFGPAQILKALKLRPKGSLCLYGLPGTGKTQFAEQLALELAKPLLIKRASELFDKYLGESESVGRGMCRPAIEPRNWVSTECRRCHPCGRQYGCIRKREYASDSAWSETLAYTEALYAGWSWAKAGRCGRPSGWSCWPWWRCVSCWA